MPCTQQFVVMIGHFTFWRKYLPGFFIAMTWLSLTQEAIASPQRIRIATYNLNNYSLGHLASRQEKSFESIHQINRVILSMRPDVLAVQEVANPESLHMLQRHLRRGGLDLTYSSIVQGPDPHIQIALLSRYPIVKTFDHSTLSFTLYGRPHSVLRNFLEVEIEVHPGYRFRLINAHLKSKRPILDAIESEIRQEEARLLRDLVHRRMSENRLMNLMVLGDFNDFPDSKTIRLIKGSGKTALVDTRPCEVPSNGTGSPGIPGVSWTHYYEKQDSYGRLDYVFISQSMAKEWIPEESRIGSHPHWYLASDHRLVMTSFHPQDR